MSDTHDALNNLYGAHLADQVEKRILQDEVAKLTDENNDLTELVRLLVVPSENGVAVLQAENRALRDMLTAAHSNVKALLAANEELQAVVKRLCQPEPKQTSQQVRRVH